MKTLIAMSMTLMIGCVNLDAMTDQERTAYLTAREDAAFDRDIAILEAKEKFINEAAACTKAGGIVVVNNGYATRIKNVRKSKSDYRTAACAMH